MAFAKVQAPKAHRLAPNPISNAVSAARLIFPFFCEGHGVTNIKAIFALPN